MTAYRNAQELPADDTVTLTFSVDENGQRHGVEAPVFVEDTETLTLEELSPDYDPGFTSRTSQERLKKRSHQYQRNHPGTTIQQSRQRMARPRVIDFRLDDTFPSQLAERYSPEGLVMTPKQVRRRAMRKLKKNPRMSVDEAFEGTLKPLAEWDMEELARGRPKNDRGTFEGKAPAFISRQITEEAFERFKLLIREEMNAQTIVGLRTLSQILDNERMDHRGRPVVPASIKVDIAKFFLEHVVGKAVQPTQTEISVKLQGILGAVMVNPAELVGLPVDYTLAQRGTRGVGANPQNLPPELEGIIDAVIVSDSEDEDEDE